MFLNLILNNNFKLVHKFLRQRKIKIIIIFKIISIIKYKKDYYDKADVDFLGLIAEEVAEVSTYLADYENEDRTGLVENVRYANIVVPLVKAIQEMNTKLDEQNQTIQNLQEQINILAK